MPMVKVEPWIQENRSVDNRSTIPIEGFGLPISVCSMDPELHSSKSSSDVRQNLEVCP